MKNNGKADTTITWFNNILTAISKHADIENPEEVKQFIANKQDVTNATKRNYCVAYNHYCEFYGIQWQMPKYKPQPKRRKIPTTEQINILIARASTRLSLKLRVSKETGVRPIELCNLKVKDIDTNRKVIYPTTAKNGNPRTLKITNNLSMALQNHVNKNRLSQNDKLFGSNAHTYGHAYLRMRNNLANERNDQTLKSIRLYDFRHYFATRLYAKTRDILYVKQQMGHKNVETTLIYTQLINESEEDEYTCKTATTVKEATDLLENGFEYIQDIDGIKIYRKRK